MANTELPPQLTDFSVNVTFIVPQLFISYLKNNNLKIACTSMEFVDENVVIDLIENQKFSY